MILLLAFAALWASQGVRLSFGAFIKPWEEAFATDRGTLSLISMISFIVYGISQPIVGKLIDTYGTRKILTVSIGIVGGCLVLTSFVTSPWQLMLLYAIFASIGFGGASNVTTSVLVNKWFHAKKGLAFGLMEAGAGAGQMLIVPASLFFIDWFGWQETALLQGAFLIVIVCPAILLFIRNEPAEKQLVPLGSDGQHLEEKTGADEKGQRKGASIFRTRLFWFLVLPFFVCGITTTGLIDTHLIPFSHDHGFSTSVTSTAVSLLAACNIAGILMSGYLADRWSSRKMLGILYLVRAVSLTILLFTHDPAILLGFAILFGLVDFATVAPTQVLAAHYFQQYSIGQVLGWIFLGHQIGSALGAYLPGVLYNVTGNYNLSFFASIILLLGASFLHALLPEPVANKQMKKEKEAQQQEANPA
ncbi:MFS transporter [Brevibacillus migulae]|uniref:MFS transporter n=1 Tax=Brevibacillus migulae TaxID=1644114 RepID=UPI001F47898E|nr:MFS transporter [Brevibacillus migulae]